MSKFKKWMRGLTAVAVALALAVTAFHILPGTILAGDGNLIIVLDPGHGASDPGATNSSAGLLEKNLNLSVALYTKAELEKYDNVTVYLTRTTDSEITLVQRTQFAVDKKANVVISQHFNAGGGKGAEAYVSLNKQYALTDLATQLLSGLAALGINNRGVKTRQYDDKHPNLDYYHIIREPVARGIPGMLLEHCFIDSTDTQFINTDDKLKKIGVADATSIATYYKLKLKSTTAPTTTPLLNAPSAQQEQALTYVKQVGATADFQSLIPLYFKYGQAVGLDPIVLIAQASVETGYGKFGGTVPASYCNPCGLKAKTGSGDSVSDFARFDSWDTGVQAHVDHLALYAGAAGYPKASTPDPRHFPYLLGMVKTVEGLVGTWASASTYATSITSIMNKIKAVPATTPTLTLNANTVTLEVGQYANLTATLTPEGSVVTWSSDNTAVATVNDTGKIVAIAAGTATITARCGTVAATVAVTVTAAAPTLTLSATLLELMAGQTSAVTAAVQPAGSTVTWSSDKPAVATVDGTGNITGVAVGTAMITAQAGATKATVTVTVTPSVPVPTLALSLKSASLNIGDTAVVTATVTGTNSPVIWSSDKPEVATVDSSGTVTGVSAGKAKITAQMGELSASVSITVISYNIPLSNGSRLKIDTANQVLTGIQPDTSVGALGPVLADLGITAQWMTASGKPMSGEALVGTGCKVSLIMGDVSLGELTLVIHGDATGDGKITSLDLLTIQRHILTLETLKGAYLMAADASFDDRITSLDLLAAQRHILGMEVLAQ